MTRDEEHLRLLSIFHYVTAGLTACLSAIFLFHVVFGILLTTGVLESHDSDARVVGVILIAVGLGAIAVTLGCAALVAYAGRCLATQKNWTFCLMIAALLCLNAPFGTVLGVFTIIVLVRDEVREMFGKRPYGT